MTFTNSEIKYVYLVKYYAKKGHEKLTENGWVKLICNSYRKKAAWKVVNLLKRKEILEEDGTKTDCNNREWVVYSLNDDKLVEFLESDESLMNYAKSLKKLYIIIDDNIVWIAKDWDPDFKPSELEDIP